jgi:hypothetical protein
MTLKLVPLVLFFAACGNVRPDDLPDAGAASDATPGGGDGTPGRPDAVVPTCLAAASYGAPTMPAAATHTAGTNVYSLGGEIDGTDDAFLLDLFGGLGVFAGGVAPGTYQIAGDETQYATCGACAVLVARLEPGVTLQDPDRIYLASSGTVEILSLSPRLTGSVSNLVLDHVRIDSTSAHSTVVGDCQTTIDRIVFDAPVSM